MTRRSAPPVGRAVLVALAVLVGGCGVAPPSPNESPGFPSGGPVEVREGPVFAWERPGARAVEVREGERNAVVWRIEAAVMPRGPRVIAPPVRYGGTALPPGVHPPDGPDFRTVVAPEGLVPGARYTVTVWWEGERRTSAAFTGPGG